MRPAVIPSFSVVGHALGLYSLKVGSAVPIPGRLGRLYHVHAAEGEFLLRLHRPADGGSGVWLGSQDIIGRRAGYL